MGVFTGFVTEAGRFELDYPKVFKAYVQRFKGQEVEIEFRARRSKRTLRQNAYWWSVVVPILAEHCGYSRDEMHAALKAKFLGKEDMTLGLMRIGSTTQLNTQEFVELTDRVVLWAAEELGVVVPAPERRRR